MKRIFVYVWAAPATFLGLIFIPLALASNGRIEFIDGVVEISGGLISKFLHSRLFVVQKAAAMTLGHVILGQSKAILEANRRHELVHVAQYERWGPLMIPLYLLSSAAARLRGEHPYWANRFERDAHACGDPNE